MCVVVPDGLGALYSCEPRLIQVVSDSISVGVHIKNQRLESIEAMLERQSSVKKLVHVHAAIGPKPLQLQPNTKVEPREGMHEPTKEVVKLIFSVCWIHDQCGLPIAEVPPQRLQRIVPPSHPPQTRFEPRDGR